MTVIPEDLRIIESNITEGEQAPLPPVLIQSMYQGGFTLPTDAHGPGLTEEFSLPPRTESALQGDDSQEEEDDVAEDGQSRSSQPKESAVGNSSELEGSDPNGREDGAQGDEDDEEWWHRWERKYLLCGVCMNSCPRCTAVCFGVTIPMLMMIGFCIFIGLFLAKNEAPYEVQQNNEFLQAEYIFNRTAASLFLAVNNIPDFCYALYFANDTSRPAENEYISNWQLQPTAEPILDLFPDGNVTVNVTDFYLWEADCRDRIESAIRSNFALVQPELEEGAGLSFNWIRCFPGATGISNFQQAADLALVPLFQPQAQADFFTTVWNESRMAYYQQLLQAYLSAGNLTRLKAELLADQNSIVAATGVNACELNGPAAAWFWFTVQATIGYGNMGNYTSFTQYMVYSLGFLSILAFGGILANASIISSAIFDDLLVRLRLRLFVRPLISCVVWGTFYYVWMCLIALNTKSWMLTRLEGQDDFTFAEGYWFAYVSSTTIGFGDLYLTPAVLLYKDLLIFPLSFQVAFVFVGAFIGKFATLVVSCFGNNRWVVQNLQDRLEKSEQLLFMKREDSAAHSVAVAARRLFGRGKKSEPLGEKHNM